LKKKSGRESHAALRQDELIGGKTASRKVTLTLTWTYREFDVHIKL
jgi:hypothetical protein